MYKYFYAGIIAVIVLLFVGYVSQKPQSLAGTVAETACTTSTIANAPIGNQLSTTVLPANGRRAWAAIQLPNNASNTVALAFNAGGAATRGAGLIMSASTTETITFGLNTDFPYTGAVTGITNVGSTTVLVTQCNY